MLNYSANFHSICEHHKHSFFLVAAKAVLCGCCAQHKTCSNLCDSNAPIYAECPPKVTADEKLPKIKEQSFKVNPNTSYEMRY